MTLRKAVKNSIIKFLRQAYGGYRVVRECPEKGCEIRNDGRSIWVHVTDQAKYDAHRKEQMNRLREIHRRYNRLVDSGKKNS